MALDFYRLDTKEYLFALDDEQLSYLSVVFATFYQWTGIEINPYRSMQLTVENCRTLLTIIEKYVHETDLNRNKKTTTSVLQFSGLLRYFSEEDVDFQLHGD